VRNRWTRFGGLGATVASAALVLSSCGGSSIEEETQQNKEKAAAAGDCGELNMAINPWVGYEADAYVVGNLAESELGCTVNYKDLKEDVSWQGFGTGEVDVVIEDWGHPDLEKKFFEGSGDGSAMDFGPTGNVGIIGWYVPPWLAEAHPDILDYRNLNKYADQFATSESGGKGQFLGADPSYVQFDEALVSNLDLNFKVVFSGSEAASIEAFQKAEKNKEFLIGYFYEPQWLFAELPLQRVSLPPYEEGCQAKPAKVDCEYPETVLKKIVSTEWVDSGSPAVDLVKNFEWSNEDQNAVAKYISQDKMSPEDAAQKWIDDNPDKVEAWLG
jgi:glycine betaine/proline transport system substrate-binding protein